eukprot:COSAG03_NODE_27058_length_255_cov_0.993590_1_plen_84_part_11
MFTGNAFGGTFLCASSVDAVQVYDPGDTCSITTLAGQEWLGKNGACDVETGLCAPGTDCSDCPDDQACPRATSCACEADDFCCY